MRKSFTHTLILLVSLVGLIACRYTLPIPAKMIPNDEMAATLEVVPISTIPPGVNGGDIRGLAPDALEAFDQMAQEHPGLSFGISGTYAEQVTDTYDAFRVEENTPFVG